MAKGKFVWYELMTSDMAGAAAFYTSVVGWQAQDSGMPGMAYTIFNMGGTGAAGLMEVPEDARKMGAQPAWMGYIAVDDVDAHASRVTAAGGAMHRPPGDIPGVGRFAVMGDPQGTGFMLFKPFGEPPQPPPPPNAPGFVGWRELHATDLAPAFQFYADMFGWTKDGEMDMKELGIYQMFAVDGTMAGGMMQKMPHEPRPFWLFYFNVAGIDAAVDRIAAAGGRVLHGPVQVPGGSWIVQGMDPQGALFALVGPKS